MLHPPLDPKAWRPKIQILKLDHNDFGSVGVNTLAEGLAVNPTLKMLSMTYCGIDALGAQGIFEILIFTKSALEELNLTGNLLRNEGVIKVLLGVSIAKSLKKIGLADNQFSCDDEQVMKTIDSCMCKNTKLGKYDFRYNIVTTNCKCDDGLNLSVSDQAAERCFGQGDPRQLGRHSGAHR